MIDFLIKSTLSLTVLLAVYHLVLEKEKIHQFNRYYLLFCLVFSFVIPFITLEIIQESSHELIKKPVIITGETTMTVLKDQTDYWMIALWSIYGIITMVFAYRFVKNISKLIYKQRNNATVAYKNASLILLDEKILPHTFLNCIFINKEAYYTRKIEEELYTHELIHVTQKHTIDILLIETFRVFFWFNPLFLLYKKAIQLNHEFLADEQVVTAYNNVPFYQNLLLSVAHVNTNYYLASNLNYSITKKRFIMMTKTTSAITATLKIIVLIPLFSGIVFLSCAKKVEKEQTAQKTTETKTPINGMEKYFEETTFSIKDENGNTISNKKFNELTTEEKKMVPPPPPPAPPAEHKQEMTEQPNEPINPKGPQFVEINMHSDKIGHAYNTTEVTEKPTFPGGMEAFYKFVAQNYKISDEASNVKLKGKVYIIFTVEKDGSLSEIKNLKDIGYGTGEEAIRVLKMSPKWIPGKLNNEPVRTQYSLPITIQTGP